MEEIIRAIILGIVQGITEFLPISSSGHLEIFNKILSEKHQENMTMTVVLHFATALSSKVSDRLSASGKSATKLSK